MRSPRSDFFSGGNPCQQHSRLRDDLELGKRLRISVSADREQQLAPCHCRVMQKTDTCCTTVSITRNWATDGHMQSTA